MRRTLAVLLAAGLLAGAQPAAAQGPLTTQFWYSFGGKNREVTEAHIKKLKTIRTELEISVAGGLPLHLVCLVPPQRMAKINNG